MWIFQLFNLCSDERNARGGRNLEATAPPLSICRFRLTGFWKWTKGEICTFCPRLNLRKFHVVVEIIIQALFRAWVSPLMFLNQSFLTYKKGKKKRVPRKTKWNVSRYSTRQRWPLINKCFFFTLAVPQQPIDSSVLITVPRQASLFTV